jgi:hypothetical protein
MVRLFAGLLLLVCVTGHRMSAAEGPPEPSESPSSTAPVQETRVTGTPPDLTGHWLSVGWIEKPDKTTTSFPTVWDIALREGKPPVLTQRFVTLPPQQKEALDKANAAGRPWQPSSEDLAKIRAAWDTLPAEEAHVAHVTNELIGRDGFDDNLKAEARTKDATWVMRQRKDFDASGAPVIREVAIYSALAPSDGGFTGNYDSATVAAAPFPIPISFKGNFRLYRLDGPGATGATSPPRGFLSRLFDVFSGCGRSRSTD